MVSLIEWGGKPTRAALAFAARLERALEEQQGALIRLHLKSYGIRGRVVNPGAHNVAFRMLQRARVKFFEGNDAPDGNRIGDYIGMLRSDARAILDRISAARHRRGN